MVNDPQAPLHGQALPDLSGSQGRCVGATFAAVTTDFSPGAMPYPPFYTVVWVVRVK